MCHTIVSVRDDIYFWECDFSISKTNRKPLLGIKSFVQFKNGRLTSQFIDYDYHLIEDEVGFKVIDEKHKHEQPIEFYLPVLNTENPTREEIVWSRICGGFHISQFRFFSTHTFIKRLDSGIIYIPVAFDLSSIVFFDGSAVSVSYFYILDPKLLRNEFVNIRKHFPKVSIDLTLSMIKYKEIYKKLEQEYKRKGSN